MVLTKYEQERYVLSVVDLQSLELTKKITTTSA